MGAWLSILAHPLIFIFYNTPKVALNLWGVHPRTVGSKKALCRDSRPPAGQARLGNALEVSGNSTDSKHKHAYGRSKHEQRGQTRHDSTNQGTRLPTHDFAVTGDSQNAYEKEWSEQAVDNRRPE